MNQTLNEPCCTGTCTVNNAASTQANERNCLIKKDKEKIKKLFYFVLFQTKDEILFSLDVSN